MTASETPLAPPGTFVIFDSNAIRALGPLSETAWLEFRRRWSERGLQTGWIPHVACEIVASNVARKSGLTVDDLREVQRAAARFHELAKGTVLHDVDEVVYRSIYDLAETPAPPSGLPDRRHGWGGVIELFVRINRPDQIRWREETDPDRLVVDLIDNSGDSGVSVVQERHFLAQATERLRMTRERHGHIGAITWEQMARDVFEILPECWASVAQRLGIPGGVFLRASQQDADRILRNPFVIRQIFENAYYHYRAFPRHRGESIKPSSVKPNDAPDLAVTTYLTPGRALLTRDGPLRRLVDDVMDTSRPPELDRFTDQLWPSP